MKLYKRLAAIVVSIVIIAVLGLSGCSLFGRKEDTTVYEISTAEELAAMEGDKSYKLTADIDIKNTMWTPIQIKNLDGDGHTIKNAIIAGTSSSISNGFFTRATALKNVTFDNIQITTIITVNLEIVNGGIAVGYCPEVENVTVQNSKATYSITSVSNYNIGYRDGFGGVVGTTYTTGVTSCAVIDSELSVSTSVTHALAVGGVVGSCNNASAPITDCYAKGVKIMVNASSGGVDMGGVLGAFGADSVNNRGNETMSGCYSNECTISGTVTGSDDLLRIGGVTGYVSAKEAKMVNCASVENEISGSAKSSYNIAGIAARSYGSVRNCFASDNTITCKSSATSQIHVAGIVGSSDGTITRSVAQNNQITTSVSAEVLRSAGICSNARGSLTKCAVYNNTLMGNGTQDAFAICEDNIIQSDCYIGTVGTISTSRTEVSLISDEDWETIIDLLSLDENYWKLKDGVLTLKILG